MPEIIDDVSKKEHYSKITKSIECDLRIFAIQPSACQRKGTVYYKTVHCGSFFGKQSNNETK